MRCTRPLALTLLAALLAGCGDDSDSSPATVLPDATIADAIAETSDATSPDSQESGEAESGADGASSDGAGEGGQDADADLPGSLVLPAAISLPYVVAGAGGATVTVQATNPGQAAIVGITWKLDGHAHLHLASTPKDSVAAGGVVDISIVYDGSATEEIAGAVLTATASSVGAQSKVWAVAGDPALGMSAWDAVKGAGDVDCGEGTTVSMPTAPFPDGASAWTDDSVRVYFPPGYRDIGAQDVVVHFHGFNATLQDTLAAHSYQQHVCASGVNAMLVVPQGPLNAASGDFGKLMHAGGLEALLRQALVLAYREGKIASPALGNVVLTSHSGGYQAVAANLAGNPFPVTEALLFDSLYGLLSSYEAFVKSGGRLISNYTSGGGTDTENQSLGATLSGDGIAVASAAHQKDLRDTQAVIDFADTTHGGSTRIDGIYGEALRFGSKHHARGPRIELRQALVQGGNAHVSWLAPVDESLTGFEVQLSQDGPTWQTAAQAAAGQDSVSFPLPGNARVRILPVVPGLAPADTLPSDTGWMSASPTVLIVDGFDRVLGGSFGGLHHDFAARVGEAAGTAQTISHRAIVEDGFDLSGHPVVIWLLGDESSADMTFSPEEQALLTTYVAAGGRLVVSGSEVGWDLDGLGNGAIFLTSVLGASLDQDDSGSGQASGTGPLAGLGPFVFVGAGKAYVEDYPDSLFPAAGAEVLLQYDNGQAAAVGRPGKTALIGFPIELLDPAALAQLVQALLDYVK